MPTAMGKRKRHNGNIRDPEGLMFLLCLSLTGLNILPAKAVRN